jgi:hypothetical protein
VIVLALAPIAFLVVAIVIGAETHGYSQMHDSISTLALTSNGDWQTANFVIGGIFVLALGVLVGRSRSERPGRWHASGAISFFGLVMILSAVFKTDPNGIKTPHGAIHVVLFVAGVAALLTAQFTIALRTGVGSRFGLYSGVTFLVGLGGFIAILVVYHWQGIAQRVLLGVAFAWVTVAARRYLREQEPLPARERLPYQ